MSITVNDQVFTTATTSFIPSANSRVTQINENGRQPFLPSNVFSLLMLINPAIVSCVISIAGIGTNLLNIATFLKMGFAETVNVSLLLLSATDLANLLTLLWMSLCYNPAFCQLVCDVLDVKTTEDFIGGVPRTYFTIASGCVTAVIAGERCLCVLRPLTVKTLLTKRKLLVVYATSFLICLVPIVMIFCTTGLGWATDPKTNRSFVTRTHKDHLYQVDYVCFLLLVVISVSTFVAVSAFTSVIVWKLASQSRWRAGSSGRVQQKQQQQQQLQQQQNEQQQLQEQRQRHDQSACTTSTAIPIITTTANNASIPEPEAKEPPAGGAKKGVTGRDRRATMTVTLIAVMYIVCFFPGTVLHLVMSLVPEFNKGMLYTNMYDFLWYLAFVGEGICSSANIIIYLKTSTRYKETFVALFSLRQGNKMQCP